MPNINNTRVGNNMAKRSPVSMVISVNADTRKNYPAAGHYRVANLPDNCLVTSAHVVVEAGGAGGPMNVGTSEGGAELMSAVVLTAAGVVGALVAPRFTGTGRSVFVQLAAAPVGTFHIVLNYVELDVLNGSLTRVDTIVS